jgi:hypothetical protein
MTLDPESALKVDPTSHIISAEIRSNSGQALGSMLDAVQGQYSEQKHSQRALRWHTAAALQTRDLERVVIDTTVQEKAIAHPSDARLTHRTIEKLVDLAKREGVSLRQSYRRLAKRAAIMVGRCRMLARSPKRPKRNPAMDGGLDTFD